MSAEMTDHIEHIVRDMNIDDLHTFYAAFKEVEGVIETFGRFGLLAVALVASQMDTNPLREGKSNDPGKIE